MTTIPKITRKEITRRAWGACRKVTAIGGVFVLMFQTVIAGPVLVNDVVQRVSNLQGLVDLRVRNLSQEQDTKGSGSKTGQVGGSSQTGITTDSLLTTVNVDTPKIGVDVVDDAIVEGTVCDCGEIILPAAGFPKWPLLLLAAIPLIFLKNNDCQDCNPIPTPTCLNCSPAPTCLNCDTVAVPSPTPTPTIGLRSVEEVPEPASLILFGTGLLAFAGGLRRRYSRKKRSNSDETGEDEK
jgi:hypothetical protein